MSPKQVEVVKQVTTPDPAKQATVSTTTQIHLKELLRKAIESGNLIKEDNLNLAAKVEELTAKVEEVTKDNQTLCSTIQRREAKITKLNGEISTLDALKAEAENVATAYEQENTKLKAEIAKSRAPEAPTDTSELNARIANLEKQLNDKSSKYDQQRAVLADYKAKLNLSVAELDITKSECKKVQNELEAAIIEKSKVERKCDGLINEAKAAEQANAIKLAEIETIKTKLMDYDKRYRMHNDELNTDLIYTGNLVEKVLGNVETVLAKSASSYLELHTQFAALDANESKLKARIAELEEAHTDYEEEITALKKERDGLLQKLACETDDDEAEDDKANNDNDDDNDEILNALTDAAANLTAANEKCATLEAEIKSLKEDAKAYEETIKETEKNRDQYFDDAKKWKNRFYSVDSPVTPSNFFAVANQVLDEVCADLTSPIPQESIQAFRDKQGTIKNIIEGELKAFLEITDYTAFTPAMYTKLQNYIQLLRWYCYMVHGKAPAASKRAGKTAFDNSDLKLIIKSAMSQDPTILANDTGIMVDYAKYWAKKALKLGDGSAAAGSGSE